MKRSERTQRIDRVLATAGVGTRKEVRSIVRSGRVTVDGQVVRDPAAHVDADDQAIAIDGAPVAAGCPTFMLNKPRGLITAASDPSHPTVLQLFPRPLAHRMFPAGRLDKNTEGLLIVTGDGDLCHKLISPRHGVEKEYLAHLSGELTPDLPDRFASGIKLNDGETTRPARLDIVQAGPKGVARVIVTEGKYHQVKRMFGACGLAVTALRRLRIGGVRLDDRLRPGEYRELSAEEIESLFLNP